MSSGPGRIQQLILSSLSKDPLLYNKLLWELAETSGALVDSGQYGGVRKGEITRSFAESYRRAVKSLESDGMITITERKFETIQEALSYSPYLTTRLELHLIRMRTQTPILDFISSIPRKNRKIDFEEYTAKFLKENDPEIFADLVLKWRAIEREIFSFIPNYPKQLDVWISIINRGRFLFEGRKPAFDLPLHLLVSRINPNYSYNSTKTRIEFFVEEMSKFETWRVGKIKYDLYNVISIGRNTKTTSIEDELKQHIFKVDKSLYINMPGHVEPEPRIGKVARIGMSGFKIRKFDPLLDKILSRDIFKSHKYLSLHI